MNKVFQCLFFLWIDCQILPSSKMKWKVIGRFFHKQSILLMKYPRFSMKSYLWFCWKFQLGLKSSIKHALIKRIPISLLPLSVIDSILILNHNIYSGLEGIIQKIWILFKLISIKMIIFREKYSSRMAEQFQNLFNQFKIFLLFQLFDLSKNITLWSLSNFTNDRS